MREMQREKARMTHHLGHDGAMQMESEAQAELGNTKTEKLVAEKNHKQEHSPNWENGGVGERRRNGGVGVCHFAFCARKRE